VARNQRETCCCQTQAAGVPAPAMRRLWCRTRVCVQPYHGSSPDSQLEQRAWACSSSLIVLANCEHSRTIPVQRHRDSVLQMVLPTFTTSAKLSALDCRPRECQPPVGACATPPWRTGACSRDDVLLDCPRLTWSLGCTRRWSPRWPPSSSQRGCEHLVDVHVVACRCRSARRSGTPHRGGSRGSRCHPSQSLRPPGSSRPSHGWSALRAFDASNRVMSAIGIGSTGRRNDAVRVPSVLPTTDRPGHQQVRSCPTQSNVGWHVTYAPASRADAA